ncbi:MAG: SMP-30/gluconolactonase/LRE family protein [Proteobacteria bacterium]|jgi:hypothetical protein|nr:SMP-30/gluconolactonase/LRE family protein [Pseudomonadota bacterium]
MNRLEHLARPLLCAFALVAAHAPFAACDETSRGSSSDTDADTNADTDSDSDTDADAGTDAGTDSDADTDSDTESDACDSLPAAPLFVEELSGPVGFKDVVFDTDGFVIGAGPDGDNLFKAATESAAYLFVDGVEAAQGMDVLPGGDLVAATSNYGLVRIDPAGTVTSLVPALHMLYGVMVGPDGMVYCADNTNLYRVDPSDGAYDLIVSGISARGADFSPDHTRLYISSNAADIVTGAGRIYVAELDDELEIIAAPTLFASIPDAGNWLDGIRVDACGNVYVPSYGTHSLYRISEAGEVSTYYSWAEPNRYGHGLKWGSGVGGWDDMSIFLPQPYDGNTVVRLEVGVHYRD